METNGLGYAGQGHPFSDERDLTSITGQSVMNSNMELYHTKEKGAMFF